jgi:hypothetical protein
MGQMYAFRDSTLLGAVIPGPVVETGIEPRPVQISAVDRGDIEENTVFERSAQRSSLVGTLTNPMSSIGVTSISVSSSM